MGKSRRRSRSRSREGHVSRRELLKRLEKLERSRHRRSRSPSPSGRADRSQYGTADTGNSGGSSAEGRRGIVPTRNRDRRRHRRDDRSPRGSTSRTLSSSNDSRSRSPIVRSAISVVDRSLRGAAATVVTPRNSTDRYPSEAANVPNPNNNNSNNMQGIGDNTPPLQLHNDVELPEDVLKMLGEDPNKEKGDVYALHSALTARWTSALANGISKEKMEEISVKYRTPENCKTLIPPLINKEILPCLPGAYITRDSCHANFQNQLGKGLTALGKGINAVLEEGHDLSPILRQQILPFFSDAGQILTGLFFNISQTRRSLITPMLSKSLKEVVETSTPGEYLFGNDLGEKIKEAKILERAAKDLRPLPVRNTFTFKKGGGTTSSRQQTTKPFTNYNYNRPSGQVTRPLNQKRPARQRREAMRRGQSPRTRNQQRR